MKVPAVLYVIITTLFLVLLTVMVAMDMPFNWVFYMTCIGQVFVVVMVYNVLTDNYTTSKTFDDFYEDHPIRKQKITS
ncbi:hypothetical protein BXY82_1246 [Gelidibacter sediminis]|uniref:Uncharacterized protein n=1 Tax=Gelidibacter sediminis TaxID=1608710 RepID=A0A4R7Q842_9FLAO|nr:hypothetical protein [Gelidibacter sediminis]TDU43827.1 hypothetical protein BXY82_1246 [Gelidibacter sediminis]